MNHSLALDVHKEFPIFESIFFEPVIETNGFGGEGSEPFNIQRGIKQGDVRSPTLLNPVWRKNCFPGREN